SGWSARARPTSRGSDRGSPLREERGMADKVEKTDAEWREQLEPERYRILRQKGTEPAFTGAYWDEKRPGVYRCAGCGQELFASGAKFDSGCGWPSFDRPSSEAGVEEHEDTSFGMLR